jgi:hypothetical protein
MCLRFIDPYGDACFNQQQRPILVDELRNARDRTGDAELRAHLNEVMGLVQRAYEVHTYIWFVGD